MKNDPGGYSPRIKATKLEVFEDHLIVQHFDDGSATCMRKDQYDAIALAAANCADLVKAVHGE